jgi:DNA-binding CsgD family transcriptional regulator
MVHESIGHFLTLGCEPDEAEIYLDLLSSGPASAEQLAAETGRDTGVVRRCFAALAGYGLAGPVNGPGSPMTALRPEPGLEVLSRRREAELAQARLAVTRAFEDRRRPPGDQVAQFLEVISGPAAAERVQQLERSARAEVRGLDSPPYYADSYANELELANLGRGVRYRAVYGRLALERAEYLAANVLPCGKAGEEARLLPEVTVKLLIIDQECAVVSAPGGDGDVLLVRRSALFDVLAGLFEMCWRSALPLDLDVDGAGPVRPSERRLLGLLAAGLTDDQVAGALGISRRTVFRYLESLMARTGTTNRFQLAVHAMRNEWIGPPPRRGPRGDDRVAATPPVEPAEVVVGRRSA